MWITMCITDFPMLPDVDNSVENSTSYPQQKFLIVDNSVIHSLSTRYPHPPVDISSIAFVGKARGQFF